MRIEFSRERWQSKRALEKIPAWLKGAAPPLPFWYPAFGDALVLYIPIPTAIQGPDDMLSSPLRQQILNYEPARGFAIPSFAMYDGSSDPYNHILHFNQAMILSAGNDSLLCKVFPASLKGPALAWLHKLIQRVVGCICFLILMLSPEKGKHQFTTNHLQEEG